MSADHDTQASRRRLAEAFRVHRQPEDDCDVDAIMASFSDDAVVEVNGLVFDSLPAIRAFHEQLGFADGGTLSGIEIEETRISYTDDEVVLEAVLRGVHSGPFMGLPPSNNKVQLTGCAIYRFDAAGKLANERVYLDCGPLLAGGSG